MLCALSNLSSCFCDRGDLYSQAAFIDLEPTFSYFLCISGQSICESTHLLTQILIHALILFCCFVCVRLSSWLSLSTSLRFPWTAPSPNSAHSVSSSSLCSLSSSFRILCSYSYSSRSRFHCPSRKSVSVWVSMFSERPLSN